MCPAGGGEVRRIEAELFICVHYCALRSKKSALGEFAVETAGEIAPGAVDVQLRVERRDVDRPWHLDNLDSCCAMGRSLGRDQECQEGAHDGDLRTIDATRRGLRASR